MNKVSIFDLTDKFTPKLDLIRRQALKILRLFKKDRVAVFIYLADDKIMKFYNKKFRGKDKTASVLSFNEPKNFPHPESRLQPLGEIYLKFPITNYPITQLIIHGLLHLLGYSHKGKNDRIRMEKKEKLVMRTLKFYK